MANVNPPPLRIPQAVLSDPEMAGFFLELLTVIRQLWVRTGGGSDTITNISNITAQTTIGSLSFEARAADIERRLAVLFAQLAQAQRNDDALKLAVVQFGQP